MATSQTPPPGGKKTGESQFNIDASDVRRLEAQELSFKNILKLKLQIRQADKEQNTVYKEIVKLQGQEADNAKKYQDNVRRISILERAQERAKANGNKEQAKRFREAMNAAKAQQDQLSKTIGGSLRAQEVAAAKRKLALKEEKELIKSINKERGLGKVTGLGIFGNFGTSFADLFKSKQKKQLQVDLARARAGGGVAGSGGGKGPSIAEGALAGASMGPMGAVAGAISAAVEKLKASLKQMAGVIKGALVAPFASAASLLTGQDYGMGGGAVSATGPSSLLGGLEKFASAIPFIGGLLGGLVGIFKGLVEAVLGVDQANFRVARSMNISAAAAEQMRQSFDGIAAGSDNIVVNSTRMLQSQVEIGNQLGINKQLSADILVNDVKMRDILGLEVDARRTIYEQSLATGRSATQLTKTAIGTVGSFNKLVGTSFKWSSILSEASKLGGVLGLTLTKYPEKIYKAIAATKALGFDLKQLDSTADSFLDFESSISKEMEAQVLTGRDMNLTKAREAALNNDYVTLSAEIAKNVGSTDKFLNSSRIEQEAIAQAVGMTRESLGDVLKRQAIYNRANVDDEKGLIKKLETLEKQKKTQSEISAALGEDGYRIATQVSTAEKLTEIMEKIKKVFVDFVRNSGIFDFLTNPQKINAFIVGLTDKLASAVDIVGRVIASIVEVIAKVVGFFDNSKGQELRSLGAQIRSGSGSLSGAIRSTSSSLGGTAAPSIGATVQQGAQQSANQAPPPAATQPTAYNGPRGGANGDVYLDKYKVGSILFGGANELFGLNKT